MRHSQICKARWVDRCYSAPIFALKVASWSTPPTTYMLASTSEQVLHAGDVVFAMVDNQRGGKIDLLMLLEVQRTAILELRGHQADEGQLGGAALRGVLLDRGPDLKLMRLED